jgi:hypothetical protein
MVGPTSDGAGRARTGGDSRWSTFVEWVLLTGNRTLVAVGIAGTLAASLLALEVAGAFPLSNLQIVSRLYQGLLVGNITLVTVIVSINQLLLTRELQAPGELRTQMEDVADYRREVEEAAGEIAPVQPLGFLRLLVDATRQEARRLGTFATDGGVTEGRAEIDTVVTTLIDQLDEIDALLSESDTSTFSVLSVLLETNYAIQINRLRQLKADHGTAFSDAVHESIDGLIGRLHEIDIARQYFKAVYLEQELSALSRGLLYAGLLAEAATIAALLAITGSAGGAPILPLRVLVPVTVTISLLPLSILASVIFRTATVTRLTAATLPFTTPEQERWL